jgi:uncharacterized membrane protein
MSAFMQWIHIVAVLVALGGVIFVRILLIPSLHVLDRAQVPILLGKISSRFNPILWTCIGLILVSGVYNVTTSSFLFSSWYKLVLSIKILLALTLFTINLALTLPISAFSKIQKDRPKWLLVNIALGTVILLLSAYLRRM